MRKYYIFYSEYLEEKKNKGEKKPMMRIGKIGEVKRGVRPNCSRALSDTSPS